MSDLFYRSLRFVGRHPFWLSSRPVVLNAQVTRRPGAYILASNHQSPYDIPLLMRHCHRLIDFVSIVEVFRNPFVGWLYGSMNAFPLDRSRPDSPTVRIVLDRLRRGRVVGMFPEGGFRNGNDSVLVSRRIRPGIGRVAKFAGVEIIPCVILNSSIYSRISSWLPFRRTRYGIHFGAPIAPTGEPEEIEERLIDAMVELHRVLSEQLAAQIAKP
ncbi:MAG: 1-acyl-sn-glycerol-3-phosphate acyltransferase [Burkholderiales bacterium]|nr:1-acyl-sn-glycerol-3-phosphate acyltransferase [Phycisphaerae bacterium]